MLQFPRNVNNSWHQTMRAAYICAVCNQRVILIRTSLIISYQNVIKHSWITALMGQAIKQMGYK